MSPGGADLRSAVLLHLQIFISMSWEAELSREQCGTANTDVREERQFTSLPFVSLSSLSSLSLCPFPSPSCQISSHCKHWLFPPSYSSVSPTRLLRRPQQCVAVLTAALEIEACAGSGCGCTPVKMVESRLALI